MKRGNFELTSAGFLLRPIGSADVTALHGLWTQEPVRRFLWDGKVVALQETHDIATRNERLFQESGFGLWGVRERDSADLIGFVGYWHFRTPPSLELLFGVASDHWNRGVATQVSNEVIRYGFEELAFRTIDASTDAANAASVRVLEKLRMSFHRRATLAGLDTVFYILRREEWSKASPRSAAPDGSQAARR